MEGGARANQEDFQKHRNEMKPHIPPGRAKLWILVIRHLVLVLRIKVFNLATQISWHSLWEFSSCKADQSIIATESPPPTSNIARWPWHRVDLSNQRWMIEFQLHNYRDFQNNSWICVCINTWGNTKVKTANGWQLPLFSPISPQKQVGWYTLSRLRELRSRIWIQLESFHYSCNPQPDKG